MNEKNTDDADGGNGGFGGDEERTAVIVRRITRDEVSAGVRKLGDGFGDLRHGMHEAAGFLDLGTSLGYASLTPAEVEDLDQDLQDIEARVRGIRVALKRATGPAPTHDPGAP